MTTSKTLFDYLVKNLQLPEPPEELEAIAFGLLQHFGISKTDVLTNRMQEVNMLLLESHLKRLNNSEPLQYILNEAWFYGRKFFVDNRVLIPRPETELLVQQVLKHTKSKSKILDIGTGSGCIAITIALQASDTEVSAIDISHDALMVAEKNAQCFGAHVHFAHDDILNPVVSFNKRWNTIVSNPPYIGLEESTLIKENVKAYEPHLALFSPGNPLLFYEAIARYARNHLEAGGLLAVEINEKYGDEVLKLFENNGFHSLTLGRDLANKPRIIFGQLG